MAREFGIGIVAARRSDAFRHGGVLCAAGAGGGVRVARVQQCLARDAALGRARARCSAPIPSAAPAPAAARWSPFLLDMSPAVAARGKIRRAERRGESIPEGYALDAEGRSTTDPTRALQGVVLPIGTYKGSGLAMLMDLFGGVLTGAACAGERRRRPVQGLRPPAGRRPLLYGAQARPVRALKSDYEARMDHLVTRVRGVPARGGISTRSSSPANRKTRLRSAAPQDRHPLQPARCRAAP